MNLVNSYISAFDPDAVAFFNATLITDSTQKKTINDLVLSLKANGLWTKMYAIYPMIGGTAFTHKFNLKDARDLDVAYRLSYIGGWLHSSGGATPNGSTGYARTFLTPSIVFNSLEFNHLAYYSRSATTGSAGNCFIGAQSPEQSGTNNTLIIRNDSKFTQLSYFPKTQMSGIEYASTSPTSGLFIGNSYGSNANLFIRGSKSAENSATTTAGKTTLPLFLGCLNSWGSPVFFTAAICGFASIGKGLSDAEAMLLTSIVQTYQTALGRQV